VTSLRETLQKASQALGARRIAHALIGGFALASYGVFRATVDIDLIAEGEKSEEIKSALTAVGFNLVAETTEVLHFSGLGFLDILLARRPISQAMLRAAKPTGPLGLNILGVEDVIGLKIQAYANDPKRTLRDQADIQALIEKNPALDWEKVKFYADHFQKWPEIERIRELVK
jgi:hypothetical protein